MHRLFHTTPTSGDGIIAVALLLHIERSTNETSRANSTRLFTELIVTMQHNATHESIIECLNLALHHHPELLTAINNLKTELLQQVVITLCDKLLDGDSFMLALHAKLLFALSQFQVCVCVRKK